MASIVVKLQSYNQSTGKNITNWIDQTFGNSAVSYPTSLIVVYKGMPATTYNFDSGLMPAQTKRNSASYLQACKAGVFYEVDADGKVKLDKKGIPIEVSTPENEFATMLCYTIASLFLGKNLAIIASGRGKMLDGLINFPEIESVSCLIHEWNAGGRDKNHTVSLNFDAIKGMAMMQSARCKADIESLESSSDKNVNLSGVLKPLAVKVIRG